MITKDPRKREFNFLRDIVAPYERTPYKLYSIEKFQLSRVMVLQEVLLDTLDLNQFSSPEDKTWHNTLLNRINQVLEGTQGEMFITDSHVYHSNTYELTVPDTPVGRLYSQKSYSYMNLPREVRAYILVGGQSTSHYIDVDIVNAHPTLLLEFCQEHLSTASFPILESYVFNRDQVLENKAFKDNSTLAEAKTSILMTLNTSKEHSANLGFLCSELFNEIQVIREHIVAFTKEDMDVYFRNNTEFHAKTEEKKKVSIQSLYLQTRETEYIVTLVEYLYLNTINTMNSDPFVTGFHNLQVLDRSVVCSDTYYYFTFIPFYDGLYIGSEDYAYSKDLQKHVASFNDQLQQAGSLVQFKEKSIELDFKRLNPKTLDMYSKIASFMRDVGTAEFNELLILLDVPPLKFTSTVEDIMLREGRQFRRCLYTKLIQASEDCKTPFNPTLLNAIHQKYADRLLLYKESTRYKEVQNDEKTNNTLYGAEDLEDVGPTSFDTECRDPAMDSDIE